MASVWCALTTGHDSPREKEVHTTDQLTKCTQLSESWSPAVGDKDTGSSAQQLGKWAGSVAGQQRRTLQALYQVARAKLRLRRPLVHAQFSGSMLPNVATAYLSVKQPTAPSHWRLNLCNDSPTCFRWGELRNVVFCLVCQQQVARRAYGKMAPNVGAGSWHSLL